MVQEANQVRKTEGECVWQAGFSTIHFAAVRSQAVVLSPQLPSWLAAGLFFSKVESKGYIYKNF